MKFSIFNFQFSKIKKVWSLTLGTLLVTGIWSLIFSSVSVVNAQSGALIVAPARQTIKVDPGDTTTIAIKFLNQGSSPISGVFGVADFIVSDKDGSPTFLDTPTGASSLYSAASWVKLSLDRGTITAGDKIEIQARISIPKDALPGGRYFGIYFEPTSAVPLGSGANHEAGAQITERLGGLVYIRVAGPISESAIITKFDTPSFIEYGPVNVVTEILNRGNYHISPTGTIVLYDMLGRKIDQKTLAEVNIFPNATRSYQNQLGKSLMIGRFNLKLTATFGESGQVLTATTTFWAFPVRIALIIVLAIIILILLGMLIWKTLKGRQSKLEKKLEEEIHELEELKEKVSDKLPTVPKK